jgi:hypothetical protein
MAWFYYLLLDRQDDLCVCPLSSFLFPVLIQPSFTLDAPRWKGANEQAGSGHSQRAPTCCSCRSSPFTHIAFYSGNYYSTSILIPSSASAQNLSIAMYAVNFPSAADLAERSL